MRENGASLAYSLTKTFRLPDDVNSGRLLVSMQGQECIRIENFKGILSYTGEEIRIAARRTQLCISGRRLKIVTYARDEIEITGFIQKLEFRQ